jgi:hypothetical protein
VNGVHSQDQRPTGTDRGAATSVAFACVGLYLAVVLWLFLAIRHRNDGVFTYTLDDAYIHLAIAQNLVRGHYGINFGEASSPSSSILWPFLLMPFPGKAWNMYLPLAWNVLFCGLAAWLIGRIVDGWEWWPPTSGSSTGSAVDAAIAACGRWIGRFALASILMLVANLVGLTFLGMEHGLQVLLAVACAAGVIKAYGGRPIPTWCLCAAALAPMVRYEDFALVAAVAIVLYGQGRKSTSLRLVGLSLAGPVLFSIFLVSRGLPALPISVLVKAKVYAHAGSAAMTRFAAMLRSMYWDYPGGAIHSTAWWSELMIALGLLYLIIREKQRVRRFVLEGTLLTALLQMAVGRFGWFHRYEVYAIIFTALVTGTAWLSSPRRFRSVLVTVLLFASLPYIAGLSATTSAASDVYQQQYQMHRFVADYYRQSVAVNDMGWVSYQRPAGVDVLDLWGLASPEASRQEHKSAHWLDAITRTHGVGLAIIYPDWYEGGPPADWSPLATMCITSPRVTAADRCVVFYTTALGDKAQQAGEMASFSRSLPASVKMTLGRDSHRDK